MDPITLRRHDLADIAITQVGVREVGGNNCGPEVRKYQRATWLEPGPWPWCAAFVDWCVQEWCARLDAEARKSPVFRGRDLSAWRPRTAGAADLIRWGREAGLRIVAPTELAEQGDIVVFTFGHCGIVTATQASTADWRVPTVEGNTNGEGSRDSDSGDGVWRKLRQRATVQAFVRLELAPEAQGGKK